MFAVCLLFVVLKFIVLLLFLNINCSVDVDVTQHVIVVRIGGGGEPRLSYGTPFFFPSFFCSAFCFLLFVTHASKQKRFFVKVETFCSGA